MEGLREPTSSSASGAVAQLRQGFTTGTCAAAAAKAAAVALCSGQHLAQVEVGLPNGERATLPILALGPERAGVKAAVCKDAGDDPDVTHQLVVEACVEFMEGGDIEFRAGPGVGIVTLPGLALAPGEPAINPAPRRQIASAVREVTTRGMRVTIAIPGGERIAGQTFNPRLGVMGGLSILGTDGRVRPFSNERLVAALVLSVDVAAANGFNAPVLVPGHIGRRHALAFLRCPPLQIVEAGNAIGAVLERCVLRGMKRWLLFGHPGKLAKLAQGEFDTHSSRSQPATEVVCAIASRLDLQLPQSLPTTEAQFFSLGQSDRLRLGTAVAAAVLQTVEHRYPMTSGTAVWLTSLDGSRLGIAGDPSSWIH